MWPCGVPEAGLLFASTMDGVFGESAAWKGAAPFSAADERNEMTTAINPVALRHTACENEFTCLHPTE